MTKHLVHGLEEAEIDETEPELYPISRYPRSIHRPSSGDELSDPVCRAEAAKVPAYLINTQPEGVLKRIEHKVLARVQRILMHKIRENKDLHTRINYVMNNLGSASRLKEEYSDLPDLLYTLSADFVHFMRQFDDVKRAYFQEGVVNLLSSQPSAPEMSSNASASSTSFELELKRANDYVFNHSSRSNSSGGSKFGYVNKAFVSDDGSVGFQNSPSPQNETSPISDITHVADEDDDDDDGSDEESEDTDFNEVLSRRLEESHVLGEEFNAYEQLCSRRIQNESARITAKMYFRAFCLISFVFLAKIWLIYL